MRCQKIVFKLLSFARKHPPEKKYQNLNDCVTKVFDLKSYHLRASQIESELQLAEDLPSTCFDFHQMEQVILNLLNNAEQSVAATSGAGNIRIRTGVSDDRLFLQVEDDGPGVPSEARDRIFNPFFTTKELGEGTGLGLSVSYGLVEEHGGRIELLEGLELGGACFRVTLPIIEGEPAVAERPVAQDGPREKLLDGCEILVAEDEPMVLELFSRLLGQEGAHVTLARDGQEAWERLAEVDYDLIVADLRMPKLNGQELYERAAAERPEMISRFVFATGDLLREETLAFLRDLPNRILRKPLEVETVRRVLAKARSRTVA